MGVEAPPTTDFPNVLSITTNADPGGDTNHTHALPAISAGDRVIVQFVYDSSSAPVGPSGWILLNRASQSSHSSQWYYRDVDGSEGASITWTSASTVESVAVFHRIQAGTFDPSSAPAIAVFNLNTANIDPPILTPSWGAADNLWIVSCSREATTNVTSYPYPNGNVAERQDNSCAATCWQKQNVASLDPPAFAAASSANSTAATIAVRPA